MQFYGRLLKCVLVSGLIFLPARTVLAAEPEEAVVDSAVLLVEVDPVTDLDFERDTGEDLYGEAETDDKERILKGGFAGYRVVDVDGYGGRGAEYDYLHSSPTFGAYYNRLGRNLKYSIDGSFLNDKDYYGDLLVDYRGDYRFHIRTDSLFHNLDREELFPSQFYFDSFPQLALYSASPDAPAPYGMRVEQDLATFRYKIKDFPLHLNLGYWRLFREGTKQSIFADHAFEGDANVIYAVAQPVNRKTLEGTAGFDAHLGPVDVIYTFKVRQFKDDAGIPVHDFLPRYDITGTTLTRAGGAQEHNEEPESRFYSHTVKVHSSLAGGIVGAASYSFGKRDNRSRLMDIAGAGSSSSTLHNVATDFTYTPCRQFSVAIKYRLQDVENDNPTTITSRYDIPGTIEARPSPDVRKNIVTATVALRPLNSLSFIGQYKGTFIEREDLSGNSPEGSWRHLPAHTTINRGTFSIISRPVRGLRLKALYSYSDTDSPSYGASYSDRHEGKLLATYNSSSRWGITTHYMTSHEKNEQISQTQLDFSAFPIISHIPYGSILGREKRDHKVSASVWVTPFAPLTLTASYAFLRNAVDQGILLMSALGTADTAADFSSEAHLYSLDSVYRWSKKCDLALLLQQISSSSRFHPGFMTVTSGATVIGDSAGLSEYSRTRTLESTVSARSEYRFTDNVSGTVEYAFREYRDKVDSRYTGTVQTYMVLLNAKW